VNGKTATLLNKVAARRETNDRPLKRQWREASRAQRRALRREFRRELAGKAAP
jgi:hypothetical protein